MSKDAKRYAIGAPVRPDKLVWGYSNEQHDPTRRVSVCPDDMVFDTLSSSAEARGLLLTIFCRYWRMDAPPEADHIRVECRMSKRRFAKLLQELVFDRLVRISGDKLYPAASFGPEPATAVEVRRPARPSRDMPSDWLDLREAVFARDGYGCVYCGSGRDLHCDHVHPVALGGSHDIGNLATSCATCNLSKGSKTLAEWRPDLAEAWKR